MLFIIKYKCDGDDDGDVSFIDYYRFGRQKYDLNIQRMMIIDNLLIKNK